MATIYSVDELHSDFIASVKWAATQLDTVATPENPVITARLYFGETPTTVNAVGKLDDYGTDNSIGTYWFHEDTYQGGLNVVPATSTGGLDGMSLVIRIQKFPLVEPVTTAPAPTQS